MTRKTSRRAAHGRAGLARHTWLVVMATAACGMLGVANAQGEENRSAEAVVSIEEPSPVPAALDAREGEAAASELPAGVVVSRAAQSPDGPDAEVETMPSAASAPDMPPVPLHDAAPANEGGLFVPVEIERRVVQGGWVMVALLGCSLLVLALAFERLLATRRKLVWPAPLRTLVQHPDGVDREALRVEVKSGTSVGARLVRAGLRAEEHGAADAAGVVAEIGLREVARLRTGLPLLATLANLATMLGLFGTVLGMIDAFEQIASQGSGDPRIVAGGIFKALITTAAGLGIGITALAIHAGLAARVNGRVRELEDGLGGVFDPASIGPGRTARKGP